MQSLKLPSISRTREGSPLERREFAQQANSPLHFRTQDHRGGRASVSPKLSNLQVNTQEFMQKINGKTRISKNRSEL